MMTAHVLRDVLYEEAETVELEEADMKACARAWDVYECSMRERIDRWERLLLPCASTMSRDCPHETDLCTAYAVIPEGVTMLKSRNPPVVQEHAIRHSRSVAH